MHQDWQPPSATAAEPPDSLSTALSHRQRRLIVYELCQSDQLTLRELTDRLYDLDRIGTPDRDRRTVRDSIQRTHLPVLESAGVVDVDSDTGMVRLSVTGNQAEQLRRLALTYVQR